MSTATEKRVKALAERIAAAEQRKAAMVLRPSADRCADLEQWLERNGMTIDALIDALECAPDTPGDAFRNQWRARAATMLWGRHHPMWRDWRLFGIADLRTREGQV